MAAMSEQPSCVEHLSHICLLFEEQFRHGRVFGARHYNWCLRRNETVGLATGLATELQRQAPIIQRSRIFGGAGGFGGAVLFIGGCVAMPFTFGGGSILLAVGGLAALAGTGTAIQAKVECYASKQILRELQAACERDLAQRELMISGLLAYNRSRQDLREAMDDIPEVPECFLRDLLNESSGLPVDEHGQGNDLMQFLNTDIQRFFDDIPPSSAKSAFLSYLLTHCRNGHIGQAEDDLGVVINDVLLPAGEVQVDEASSASATVIHRLAQDLDAELGRVQDLVGERVPAELLRDAEYLTEFEEEAELVDIPEQDNEEDEDFEDAQWEDLGHWALTH